MGCSEFNQKSWIEIACMSQMNSRYESKLQDAWKDEIWGSGIFQVQGLEALNMKNEEIAQKFLGPFLQWALPGLPERDDISNSML